jgi:hypothetical protein
MMLTPFVVYCHISWDTMEAEELTATLTVSYVRTLQEQDVQEALVACIAANLVCFRGLHVQILQEFARALGLDCKGSKSDISKRLKSYVSP